MKTLGEEPSYEMTEDGIVGPGKLGLGLTSDEIQEIQKNLDLENGEFFEDPEFPCGPSALFYRCEITFHRWQKCNKIIE